MMNPTILNLNENILGVQVTNFNLDVEIQYSAVVYGIDENFLMHCGISMLSIVEKTSEVPLHLFIITDKNNELEFSRLYSIIKNTQNFNFPGLNIFSSLGPVFN